MQTYQFYKIEDYLISQLDAGISLASQADEFIAIRMQGAAREKARLKILLKRVQLAEASP